MPDAITVRVGPPAGVTVRVAGQEAVSVRSTSQVITLRTQGQGPEGPTGPTGPAGIVTVEHGTDPNVARPASPVVYWVGSIAPVNAESYDLWYLT